ncbi:MAG: UDP-N-acetylmuramyl-tripeptide synthetase, partial [Clostridia bacterium]|nr:UDP-N-acetylmuramyl-tripeptide synthetase [Clostridia bacterium]
VVIEVSAHAIEQRRLEGIYFQALIFTNCTEDHLDYFRTFDSYRAVKKSMFRCENCKYMIVNSDDALGREICGETDGGIYSYGIYEPCDCFAAEVKETARGIDYFINLFDNVAEISSSLMGEYNVYNSLAAATCAAAEKISFARIVDALCAVGQIAGRCQKTASYGGAEIYVDYAHTPDGLERTLKSLRKICRNKLVCVFGCGGDREREKRSIMGKISGKYADFTIVTDDNPRFEDPAEIRAAIIEGLEAVGAEYAETGNRETAVMQGIKMLGEGDVLVVAGKGAEEYMEIKGVRYPFSDTEVIIRSLKGCTGE